MKYSFKGWVCNFEGVFTTRSVVSAPDAAFRAPVDVVPRPPGAPDGFPVGSLVDYPGYGTRMTVLTTVYPSRGDWHQIVKPNNRHPIVADVQDLTAHVEDRRVAERREVARRVSTRREGDDNAYGRRNTFGGNRRQS